LLVQLFLAAVSVPLLANTLVVEPLTVTGLQSLPGTVSRRRRRDGLNSKGNQLAEAERPGDFSCIGCSRQPANLLVQLLLTLQGRFSNARCVLNPHSQSHWLPIAAKHGLVAKTDV
jgi:hypothetical protein